MKNVSDSIMGLIGKMLIYLYLFNHLISIDLNKVIK